MILDTKSIDMITEEDLQSLVYDGIGESKNIEYKRDNYGRQGIDKKEFLKDISSFANASGGYLLIGIDEEKGLPISIQGVEIDNIDEEKLRFENLVMDQIRPRIISYKIKEVKLKSSRYVIIIHIPQSFAFPHMVTFNTTNKFYSRNSAGVYLLDVEEIRNLFNRSGSLSEQAKTFRIERLGKIVAGETPIPLESIPKMVLHLVPLNPVQSDLTQFSLQLGFIGSNFPKIGQHSVVSRSNFDGYVEYSKNLQSEPSYLQAFRNGNIEYVWTHHLWQKQDKKIPDVAFERQFIQTVKYLLALQQYYITVFPPIFIMLTIMHVRGYTVMENGAHPIDRDSLVIPDIMIENFPQSDLEIQKNVKKILDIFWNAVGYPHSPNFDNTGKWIGSGHDLL